MNSRSALFPVFRSEAQARVLAHLLLDPSREQPIASLADVAGVSQPTVLREVNALVQAGILAERRAGNARLVRADTSSPYFGPLAAIVTRTHGPASLVASELAGVAGIESAHVVGSWARRYHGDVGAPPQDVDVVVVGSPDRRALRRATSRLEDELGMPVQITVVPVAEWEGRSSGFVRQVRAERPVTILPSADA